MQDKVRFFCFLCLTLVAYGSISVEVDNNRTISILPPSYLSVSIDSSQLVGSKFWSTDPQPFNFSRPRLINMAKALSPAILRVGGTDGDKIYYDLSETPVTQAPGNYEYVMTKAEYDNLLAFVQKVNFQLVFGLNAGPGPRNTNTITQWNSSNAEGLLKYSKEKESILGYELGNESNLFFLTFGPKYFLEPNELAAAFRQLQELIQQIQPNWKLVGPDVSFEYPILGQVIPEFWQNTLQSMQKQGVSLDIATYHFYPLLSERCLGPLPDPFEATAEKYLRPFTYNKIIRHAETVKESVNEYQPQAKIWVGETAGSLCGGQPGVANRFIDSLWWMDQLGLLAQSEQTSGQIRQTLAGPDYGLINDITLIPRPDYFASLLFKQLMGNQVLNTTVNNTTYVRAYAHCAGETYPPGSVTLLMINLLQNETFVELPTLMQQNSILQFSLTPPDPLDITSEFVALNGETLQVDADGVPPKFLPLSIPAAPEVILPPNSYSFFVSSPFTNICE